MICFQKGFAEKRAHPHPEPRIAENCPKCLVSSVLCQVSRCGMICVKCLGAGLGDLQNQKSKNQKSKNPKFENFEIRILPWTRD